jgi:hypothetical protein
VKGNRTTKTTTTSGSHDSTDLEPRAPGLAASGRRGRSDSADAFIPDPEDGPARVDDDLAENLAEDFVMAATTGGDHDDGNPDEIVPEELGGPFVETSASEEFALGADESNPDDAMVEALPRAVHGLSAKPRGV